MKIILGRRAAVRIISFALAAVIAVLGALISVRAEANDTRRRLIHRYQASVEELSAGLQQLSVTLGKTLYTGTPEGMSALTNELIVQSATAACALAAVPAEQEKVAGLSKFLSQVGDYSFSLTQRVIKGGSVTEEERNTLKELAGVAQRLSLKLEEINTLQNSEQAWAEQLSGALSSVEGTGGIDLSLTEVEKALADYPTLIYDGPFSDHILKRESALLKAGRQFTREQAAQRAAEVLKTGVDSLEDYGTEEGRIPAYIFAGEGTVAAVTKSGGHLLYMRREREITASVIEYDAALKKALSFAEGITGQDFRADYYSTDEGVCTVNLVYCRGNVLCYTDLIKVGVAMDNGEVVFYESAGYIMNHRARTLKTPKRSAEQAAERLSPHLKIKNTSTAIIPSGGEREVYCYEFLCNGEQDEEVLVYINTDTLTEENILILLKTDGGRLVR